MSKVMKDMIKTNYENMQKIDKKYEILLGAQHRGEDLREIIGEDYKSFCDDVIKSYKGENKLYFLSSFKQIVLMVLVMLPFFIALNCVFEIGKVESFSMEAF